QDDSPHLSGQCPPQVRQKARRQDQTVHARRSSDRARFRCRGPAGAGRLLAKAGRKRPAQMPGCGNALVWRAGSQGNRVRARHNGSDCAAGLEDRRSLAVQGTAGRFGVVSGTNWTDVERLLATVIELPESERSVRLDELCAARPELRAEVESLLEAHES